MTMSIRRIAVLVSTIGIATLALTRAVSGQTKDERAIRSAGEAWQRYVAAQNIDSIVGLFTPDAIVMMANSPPMNGSAAVRAGWGEIIKTPGLDLHWTPTKIDVVSARVATEYGTYTESWDGPNGKQSDAGTYIVIWHKVNGKWRVAYEAPVSSMAAAPAAPAERRAEPTSQQILGAEVVNPNRATDQRTYFAFQVEKQAEILRNSPLPEYPRDLERSGVSGEVQAQFVVTRAGTADMDTFKVLKSTNELFTEAVRSILPRIRYSPAMIGGKPVNQLVQQSFHFAVPR
jgi:ketosteroid isomerase-like protein